MLRLGENIFEESIWGIKKATPQVARIAALPFLS